jgi:hypothetical protein
MHRRFVAPSGYVSSITLFSKRQEENNADNASNANNEGNVYIEGLEGNEGVEGLVVFNFMGIFV